MAHTDAPPDPPTVGPIDLVTGAFGNTGPSIVRLLHEQGRLVRTLTTASPGGPIASEIAVVRPDWHDPTTLVDAFGGVSTFYNTFWMRTGAPGSHGTDYGVVVDRSTALIEAARRAGVERIVHISVAHADAPEAQRYPYFAAKARVEAVLRASGLPHAIVRPALVFGGGPGIVDQLARVLRWVPVFGVAGDGRYRVRPVHVDDIARLCVEAAEGASADAPPPVDAVGPDRPTFDELVRWVAAAVGRRARVVRLPTPIVIAAGRALGAVLREDLLTADELRSTMDGLADTDGPATGAVSLRDWLAEPGATLRAR